MFSYKKALVLNPHSDDSELACGGTLVKLINSGCDVYYVSFTLPPPKPLEGTFTQDDIVNEVKKSTSILGIKPENKIFFDYEVRKLNFRRQQILDDLLMLKEKIKPDVVFCHSSCDVHQDHKTVHEEALRAFKDISIMGYQMPWNEVIGSDGRIFVEIDKESYKKKIEAISQYKSQQCREFFSEEVHEAIMRYNGVRSKKKYCESFECIRLISNL